MSRKYKTRKNFQEKNLNTETGNSGKSLDNESDMRNSPTKHTSKYGSNDFNWYNKYPSLITSTAQVDYATAQGVTYSGMDNCTFPGFVKFDIVPGLPITTAASDPVNISGTNMFMFLNKGKNNNRPYDSVDLSKLLIATAHVFSYVNWMQRVYGVANLFSTKNRFLPQYLVEAMGVDFNNVRRNLANFRAGINHFIYKVAALVLPSAADIPYYARMAFTFANIYIESETIKDQMYFYNPVGFLKYNVKKLSLTFSELNPGRKLLTVDDMLDYADALVQEFYGDTDVNTMCADISNAYGTNVMRLQELPENAVLVPIHDETVLEQMLNIRILPVRVDQCEVQVCGDAGQNPYLRYDPTGMYTFANSECARLVSEKLKADHFILTHYNGGSVETTVENTRMKPMFDVDDQDNCVTIIYRASSPELCTKATMYYLYDRKLHSEEMSTMNEIDLEDWVNLSDALNTEASVSKFKYMPWRYYVITDSSPNHADWGSVTRPIGSMEEYALIPDKTLANLHTSCAFSLFALPMSNVIS